MGVKIQKDNKEAYCRELRNIISSKKIVIDSIINFEELSSFGMNSLGRYEAQAGNDDVAMTCVNLVAGLEANDFFEMVEDMHDSTPIEIRKAMEVRMNAGDGRTDDMMDTYRIIRDFAGSSPQINQGMINDAYGKMKAKGFF
jgi:hypothetical protein